MYAQMYDFINKQTKVLSTAVLSEFPSRKSGMVHALELRQAELKLRDSGVGALLLDGRGRLYHRNSCEMGWKEAGGQLSPCAQSWIFISSV